MIEICFQKKQEKKGFLFEYIRKIKQKRGVCKEICIRKGEQEYIRLELPVCYGEKVKSAIENMTGLTVADVNIRVAGVDMPEEE